MKLTFQSFTFPGFQSLTLSLKASSLQIDKANVGINQRAVRATLQPIKAFVLVTYLPASAPVEVERFNPKRPIQLT